MKGIIKANYKAIIGLILAMFLFLSWTSRAQAPTALQLTGNQPHTACSLSVAGSATYCFATDGLWESVNGAAYSQVGGTQVAGVSSISVNGGTAQTGAVTLTIPTKATTTVTSTASTSIQ